MKNTGGAIRQAAVKKNPTMVAAAKKGEKEIFEVTSTTDCPYAHPLIVSREGSCIG